MNCVLFRLLRLRVDIRLDARSTGHQFPEDAALRATQ